MISNHDPQLNDSDSRLSAATSHARAVLLHVVTTAPDASLLLTASGQVLGQSAAAKRLPEMLWQDLAATPAWTLACDRARSAGDAVMLLLPPNDRNPAATGADDTISASLMRIALDDGGAEAFLLRLPPPAEVSQEQIVAMAHDLRAPLQSLFIAAEALAMRHGETGPEGELTALALLAVDQARSILEMARPGLGANPETFDLVQVVGEAARMLALICLQNGHQLVTELPPDPYWVNGAAQPLRAILQNLITNAARFNDDGPVKLRLKLIESGAEAPQAVIEVEDRGPGPSEAMTSVFGQQGIGQPNQRPTQKQGFGLGLGIVARAVAALDGSIEVAPGAAAGTLFRVTFPVSPAPRPRQSGLDNASRDTSPAAVRLDGIRILLVEDNLISLGILSRSLRDAGASIADVQTGTAALTQASALGADFDLILLDISLPDMDGLEVARQLSQTKVQAKRPKIIGLTAHVKEDILQEAVLAGFSRLLTKPIPPAKLLRILRDEIDALPPSDQTDQTMTRMPTLLDQSLIAELVTDMGPGVAQSFMLKALQEAEDVLTAARAGEDTAMLRKRIHSAIGSTGLTGLAAVDQVLRRLQDQAKAGADLYLPVTAAAAILSDTRNAIADFAKTALEA